MSDKFFLIRRYFAKPRRTALIIALIVLLLVFFLETILPVSSHIFLWPLVAFSVALSIYLLVERGERLKINVEAQTQALNQAIKELEESRAYFQKIIAESPVPTIITNDTTENIEYVNKLFVHTYGYTVEEIPSAEIWMGKAYPDPAYREKVQTTWRKAIQEALEKNMRIATQEWDVVCKDGTTKNVLFDMMPIGEKSVIIMNDITSRKEIEQELQESEARFRALFEDSADAYLILENNTFVDCNQAALNMMRASSKEDVLSTHPAEISPEYQFDGRTSVEKADEMMKIAKEEGSHRFEWIHTRLDGEAFPVEVLLTPIPVGEKKIIHTVWRDITEQKNKEETLRKNAIRLRRYFDQEFLGMAITSPEKRWVEVNDALCQMFGYSREELLEQTWTELTHPEDLDKNLDLFEQVVAGKIGSYTLEKRFLRKDGSIFYAELSASTQRKDDGSVEALITIIKDITERKATEEALKTLNIELDERVGQRTQELHQTISAMANREIRMAELKKVITQLRSQLRKAGLEPDAHDPLLGPNREW